MYKYKAIDITTEPKTVEEGQAETFAEYFYTVYCAYRDGLYIGDSNSNGTTEDQRIQLRDASRIGKLRRKEDGKNKE